MSRHRGVLTAVRDTRVKLQVSSVLHRRRSPQSLSSFRCVVLAAVPAPVFPRYLTTPKRQRPCPFCLSLDLSPTSSGLKQDLPSSNHSGPSSVIGLWSEPGDSGSPFTVSVPCASLPQAGPYPKQLGVVRVGTTFAQHPPPILSLRAKRFRGSPNRLALVSSPCTRPSLLSGYLSPKPRMIWERRKDKGLLSPASGTSSIASGQAAPPPSPTKWLQIGG